MQHMQIGARFSGMLLLSAFMALAGCRGQPPVQESRPPPTPTPKPVTTLPPPPGACEADFASLHREYALPPTVAPISSGGKGQPLQWAVSLPVNRALGDIATWRDLGEGWSSLGLRLKSAQASGIAVRLSEVALPEQSEIWLCSPDGSQRRGPLRAGTEGELYTPVVTGSEAWLEILAPTRSVPKVRALLVEVYGGFR